MKITTSSSRRVKRRTLDECDNSSIRKEKRTRKSRTGRKSASNKSFSSKLRPQRVAARNALHLFSRITGTSTDGGINGSDRDLSDDSGGSTQQDSSFVSEEESSDEASLTKEHQENSKGKEIYLDQIEAVEHLHSNPEIALTKKRLILKLPNRDSSKLLPRQNFEESQSAVASSSSRIPLTDNETTYLDEGAHGNKPATVHGHFDLLRGCKDGSVTWGGARLRSSKKLKMGHQIEDIDNGHFSAKEKETESRSSDSLKQEGNLVEIVPEKEKPCGTSLTKNLEGEKNVEFDADVCNGTTTSSVHHANGTDHQFKLKDSNAQTPIKLRIRSGGGSLSRDHEDSPSKSTFACPADDTVKGVEICKTLNGEEKISLGVPATKNKDLCESQDSEQDILKVDSLKSESLNKRMFTSVYRRSRPPRNRSNPEGGIGSMEASTSNVEKHDLDLEIEIPPEGVRRPRSIRLRSSNSHDPNTPRSYLICKERDCSEDNSIDSDIASPSRCEEEIPREGCGPVSRNSIRLRSTRSKKGIHYNRDNSPPRKLSLTGRSSWLMLSAHEEGSRYIPQLGDEVVYLRQGHQEYKNHTKSRNLGPWETIKRNIRAVEFCRVEDLEYSTLPGSGESCCKMILKFIDPCSDVAGKSFKLTLPEVTGFPDFLVEKSRYDASMARNWTSRDKCQVWWKTDGEEDGSWWEGRVFNMKPKSHEFPDSPWERCVVKYRTDPNEIHYHSPWELHDMDTHWERPHIEDDIRHRLLVAIGKLEKSGYKAQDYYGINKLKQVSQKTKFVNMFPVPLSLEVIKSRLDNNYYRSLEAMKHDVEVLLSNAESFFGKNEELSTKINRLSDWFRKTISSL